MVTLVQQQRNKILAKQMSKIDCDPLKAEKIKKLRILTTPQQRFLTMKFGIVNKMSGLPTKAR